MKLEDGSLEVSQNGKVFVIGPEDSLFQDYLVFFILNPEHRHVGLY